ncbi:MAG: acyl-CoA dehydrogenase family protein [Acidimicrobiales bacterium]|jgi:alkylation response protein AidB-like acyl-CoA dehydrogenase
MTDRAEILARAHRVADEVLFPGALETDSSPVVPCDRLEALAAAGLYGLFGPAESGGLEADPTTGAEVTEVLAGGCLTTAFVWAQHHNAVFAIANGESEVLKREWLAPLCRGERRAGVAFAGLRRPGPPVLTARLSPEGWILEGKAPWVTGWGRVEVIHTAARDLDGNVVWLLVDAVSSATLQLERLDLAAVNASATVSIAFCGHVVPVERLSLIEPMEAFIARDAAGLWRNGSFPLGLARRCSVLMDSEIFDSEIAACSKLLRESTPETVIEARSRAAELAVRAASALVAIGGGKSVLRSEHAQRLAREAMFVLVFGQTPTMRTTQLERFREISQATAREIEDGM